MKNNEKRKPSPIAPKSAPSLSGKPLDPLHSYRQKRDFTQTPEPSGQGESCSAGLQYVIQKHWASHLHYDLRLELDGAMKSWAVPKGPSYDPADKRMAVQVEDHPIAYNRFEGQIPSGQYGAGKVIVWDKGWWQPHGDPGQGYRDGKLKFTLHGHKLQGQWTLVRMRGRSGEKQPAWLLIKEQDDFARPASVFKLVDAMPDSVLTLPPIDAPRPQARSSQSLQPKAAPLPQRLAPQLATLAETPPHDLSEWQWELKFDGYRMLTRIHAGSVRLFTRNGIDWTDRMPALTAALANLPVKSAWLDGEVLMLDSRGHPDFQALQNAFDGHITQDLVYYLFDLPYIDGQDLRPLSLLERKQMLSSLIDTAATPNIRFSQAFDAAPQDLVASACKLGFEGIVGKRKTAAYTSRRTSDWIKLKCSRRQEFVIGGYTDPQGHRQGLGSLLLGVHGDDGRLRYAGNVGTGFTDRSLEQLRKKLVRLASASSPFAKGQATPRNAHWVQPLLLAEVSFAEWTQSGKLRHPVFHGLRDDKPATAITREQPEPLSSMTKNAAAIHKLPSGLKVTSPERIIDPSTGVTKLDLVRYYALVAPLMMEHLKHRPVALLRAPDGVNGERFFQKHLERAEIDGIEALEPGLDKGHAPLLEVARAQGLLAGAQMNVIEYHSWNARKDRILRPDRMTFDLDPGEGVAWVHVLEAAQLVQVFLQELGLAAFLKTSGGKGLHVVTPIKRLHDWNTVKGFSRAVVQHLASTIPQRFVAKSGPRNRVGKIFVDYLRNGFGATTACAWTARARPGMGISVPVAWSELDRLKSGSHWSLQTVEQRLRTGNSPWADYPASAVSITTAMKRLEYSPTASHKT